MSPLNTVFAILALVFLLCTKPFEARRILDEEEGQQDWVMKKENLLFQSLQRAPVPPSRANPPTNIPGPRSIASTISQKGFAGHAMPPPLPSPCSSSSVPTTGGSIWGSHDSSLMKPTKNH
ncbi:hypothetical protein U1Q18_042504 [Sarracenia purpurea var. burkii]